MVRNTRTISWLKAALKDFLDFSQDAQDKASTALTFVAEGAKPDIAKPLAGLGSVRVGVGDQVAWRRLQGRVRAPDRGRNMGSPCLPEEVEAGHRYAEAGD